MIKAHVGRTKFIIICMMYNIVYDKNVFAQYDETFEHDIQNIVHYEQEMKKKYKYT